MKHIHQVAITGALGEAGEEGAQQYAENFTKKLFDNKQDINEGVAESALMGGIMGGAGKMAFGGMESVKNPYKRNTSYDPKALYEAERNAVTPTREKITLAEAERQNRGGDLQYTPRRETNIGRLDSDQLGFTKDELIGKFTGDTRKRMSKRSFNMLQDLRANNPYMTGDGQEVYLSARGNKKLSSTSATIDDATFKARMRTTPRFKEILSSSNKTHSADDLKQHGVAPDGFDYLSSPVNVNGKRYMQEFDIGKNNETGRNTVYNSKLKEEPELSGFYTRSNSGSYGSNIAQNDQKVNAFNRKYEPEIQDLQNAYQKYGDDFEFNLTPEQQATYEHLLRESPRDSEGRYIDPVTGEMTIDQTAQNIEGALPEINQKTRKFAETVLDTDTPPKDFVKLMHAGDESLKYTPKKNSEMWNRATKSVQESPERVFNELENTRVANDETMAKGIALAKHYQAMGDDLKASELYVELAKKATEAGRTVQALNLMRRTTPEGVLMSTMREVESYNDKMKNKPNKQINITPEQRAEFLGRLREAYAMPEGDLKEIRARRIAIGEAIREVRDQIPSSKWDKFTTLWKAGLLTAPTTHIRNIAGNVINGGSEKTAQTIGSAFDWMISKGTGRHIIFYAILLIRR